MKAESILMVLLPIINCVALGARLSRVPETVTAGPPGMSVWPLMIYSDLLFAVKTCDPNVKGGSVVAGARSFVLLPITT